MKVLKPLWQDRVMVLLTHKKALANEILIGPNTPAELLEIYNRIGEVLNEAIETEIKFRAGYE